MAWPQHYRSRYRPKPGSLGWSTRHLIAEQPDSMVELAEKIRKRRMADKFSTLLNDKLREEESGWESSSTCSITLPSFEDASARNAETTETTEEEGVQPARNTSGKQAKLECGLDCWLKSESTAPSPLQNPYEETSLSSTNPNSILYKPIGAGSTRMLSLMPGSQTDPIKCVLIDDFPLHLATNNLFLRRSESEDHSIDYDYEALSYVWGSPEPKRTIYIIRVEDQSENYIPTAVTPNLYSALLHLRHSDSKRLLWVDALCIDQKNNQEKSYQVSKMMNIYAHARRVIVWLGEEADESHIAMAGINILNDRLSRKALFDQKHSKECILQLCRLYDALISLYERAWFERVWIWQEVMVARELVVCCGAKEVLWKPLKRALKRLPRLKDMIAQNTGQKVRQLSSSRERLVKLLKHRWLFGMSILGLSPERDSIYELHAGGPLELMFVSKLLRATDQRDKVYAFLGLGRVKARSAAANLAQSEDEKQRQDDVKGEGENQANAGLQDAGVAQVVVDYSLSVSEVYQQFTKYIINKYRTLDILCVMNSFPSTSDHLPSWVPDWQEEADKEFDLMSNFDYLSNKLSTAGDTVAELQNPLDWGKLHATGFFVDRIDGLLPYTTNIYGLNHVHNVLFRGMSEGKEYADDIEIVLREGVERDPKVFKTFGEGSHESRRCCRTSTGRVCLVPRSSRPGDHIWILKGARLPMVLYEAFVESEDNDADEDQTSDFRDDFNLVGPCYVPDLASGGFYNHYFGSCDEREQDERKREGQEEDTEEDKPIIRQIMLI